MKYIPASADFARLVIALVLVVAAAGVAVTPAVAQSDQPDWAAELYGDLTPMVETYNENVNASDLGIAASQLRNEQVNLVVTDTDGSEATASFRLDSDLRIQDLSQGPSDDATMRMSTDRETMTSVIEASDPSAAFQNAIADRDIRINGIGTVNAVKWTVLNTLADIFG